MPVRMSRSPMSASNSCLSLMCALRTGESGETLSHGAAPCALPSRAARRPGAGAGRAWIAHNVVDHQSVPNEQHEQRADGRADQAGTLVEPIPSDGLTDEGGEESADDAEQRRQDEAA